MCSRTILKQIFYRAHLGITISVEGDILSYDLSQQWLSYYMQADASQLLKLMRHFEVLKRRRTEPAVTSR